MQIDLTKDELVALKLYRAHAGLDEPSPHLMTRVEQRMLDLAQRFCERIGLPVTFDVRVVERLGAQVYGMVRQDTRQIILSAQAFRVGTKQVAATLIEEQLHLAENVADETRAMQEALLLRLVHLGEQLKGEPL